jgi:hypothetical protein
MKIRVLHSDSKTKTGATDRPSARCVSTPEAVKNLSSLACLEPDPVIANCYSHGCVVTLDEDVDRMALAMLDRIDKEISENSFDTTGVNLGPSIAALMQVDLGVVGLCEGRFRLNNVPYQIA